MRHLGQDKIKLMKKYLLLLTTAPIGLNLTPAFAQMGRTPSGPSFDGATGKLLGEHSTFTANLEFQTTESSGGTVTMPGKIAFDAGKSRFEMNMSEMKGSKMPPNAAANMKAMGMDTMYSISRPDKKLTYTVYPGLRSYVEATPKTPPTEAGKDDYKVVVTELGKETVDGHPCIKNKVVVTDKEGKAQESTIWNATDLKKFPVKIMTIAQGNSTTMLFKNVSLDKPDASSFEAPDDYTKYQSMQTMMQTEMIKKMGVGGAMGGGMGMPPGR